MSASKELRKELKRIGAIGGRNRWKGVNKRRRVAHARIMVAARKKRNGA